MPMYLLHWVLLLFCSTSPLFFSPYPLIDFRHNPPLITLPHIFFSRTTTPIFGLTKSQRALAIALCSKATNQRHLFEHWDSSISTETVENDEQRRIQFMNQLSRMDKSYSDGGLIGYLRNARALLADASAGVNPLDGWIPSVPTGTHLDPLGSSSSDGKADYETYERIGCDPDVIGRCGFVLVAGGLGERLGYRGVKVCVLFVFLIAYFVVRQSLCQERQGKRGKKRKKEDDKKW